MEDLKLYVNESLFSDNDENDVVQTAEEQIDKEKTEKLLNWRGVGLSKLHNGSKVKYENGGLSIYVDEPNMVLSFSDIPSSLLPLNIRRIVLLPRAKQLARISILFSDLKIKDCTELFAQDFDDNMSANPNFGLNISFSGVSLNNYEGLPQKVMEFTEYMEGYIPYNVNYFKQHYKGIPKNISYHLTLMERSTPSHGYDTYVLNSGDPLAYRSVNRKNLEKIKVVYDYLDPNCKIAKCMLIQIKQAERK